MQVRFRVPQGSALGPLLIIIYVNDIYSVIHHSKHGMFADDLILYKEVSTLTDCELLQSNISCWSQWWQLELIMDWFNVVVTNKQSPLSC